MNKERAITYSLLAHIRNKGSLIKGPLDIFKPLVKRTISLLNSEGIYSGKSIIEIKDLFEKLYNIDIPIPVLKKILKLIVNDVNTDEVNNFVLYDDGAFSITKYTFAEYEDTIIQKEAIIQNIETLFEKFCKSSNIEINDSSSIFKFIENNKFSLSKYFSNNVKTDNDFTAEAQFVKFFKNIPSIYSSIKDIYIGSIISSYIQYNPSETKIEVELLFDTNFIVGLLNLNTPESEHTCKTLLSIAKKQNYRIRVLKDTIEETRNLLIQKAKHFNQSFLVRRVYTEDIYNACDRRSLKKIDLERIADNLESEISKLGISAIHDQKSKNEARHSSLYKKLKDIRNSDISALHDATAVIYVNKVRSKKIKEFEKVNCWFVNNNITRSSFSYNHNNGFQPESINADDLLNILWLSNPQTKLKINSNDLADIGITSSISISLNKNLPKAKFLRELDDNIHKYTHYI